MINANTVIDIMRLTEGVYECDKLEVGQNPSDFKPIQKTFDPKRYIRFDANDPHHPNMAELTAALESIGADGAVIKMVMVGPEYDNTLSLATNIAQGKYYWPCVFVDLSKLDEQDTKILLEIIKNTTIKMKASILEDKLDKTIEKMKNQADKFKDSMSRIRQESDKAKSSLFSRNVNMLKQVIGKEAEHFK